VGKEVYGPYRTTYRQIESVESLVYIPIGRILDLLLVDPGYRVPPFPAHLSRSWPPADRLHIVVQVVALRGAGVLRGCAARGSGSGSTSISSAGRLSRRTHPLEVLPAGVHRNHFGGVSIGEECRECLVTLLIMPWKMVYRGVYLVRSDLNRLRTV